MHPQVYLKIGGYAKLWPLNHIIYINPLNQPQNDNSTRDNDDNKIGFRHSLPAIAPESTPFRGATGLFLFALDKYHGQ